MVFIVKFHYTSITDVNSRIITRVLPSFIQNNLERSEFETKTMLSQRIEDLEKENTALKRKKEAHDEQHNVVIDAFQDREREHLQELEATKSNLSKLQEELNVAKDEAQRLKQQVEITLTLSLLRNSFLTTDHCNYSQ